MPRSDHDRRAESPRQLRPRRTIVFVMPHLGLVRYFDPSIRLLSERGHSVVIADLAGRATAGVYGERLTQTCPTIRLVRDVEAEPWRWARFARALRLTMDYIRYLDSRFDRASILKERVDEKFAPRFARVLAVPLRLFGDRGVRAALRFLQVVESAIPLRPRAVNLVRETDPDVLLVTPLVDFGSALVDYVKAAQAAGVPTGVCVASWDNLTNKGHIHIVPDRVFVWNAAQKKEAVEFHGAGEEQVVLTGAQTFDRFFEWTPQRDRERFCADVGLDASRPFVLFLGSTQWVAPEELHFIERWVRAIRNSTDEVVANLGILLRPHPTTARRYLSLDVSQIDNVRIWPPFSPDPADYYSEQGQREFFESLWYSAAAVGVNTSALIEAGIVGRTVCTLRVPEFQHSQQGTLHFAHLANRDHGLLRSADDLDEHLEQLHDIVNGEALDTARTQAFVADFVRPRGLDVPAAPVLADAIEDTAALQVASKRFGRPVVSSVLLPLAWLNGMGAGKRRDDDAPWWVVPARPLVRFALRIRFSWVRLVEAAPASGAQGRVRMSLRRRVKGARRYVTPRRRSKSRSAARKAAVAATAAETRSRRERDRVSSATSARSSSSPRR